MQVEHFQPESSQWLITLTLYTSYAEFSRPARADANVKTIAARLRPSFNDDPAETPPAQSATWCHWLFGTCSHQDAAPVDAPLPEPVDPEPVPPQSATYFWLAAGTFSHQDGTELAFNSSCSTSGLGALAALFSDAAGVASAAAAQQPRRVPSAVGQQLPVKASCTQAGWEEHSEATSAAGAAGLPSAAGVAAAGASEGTQSATVPWYSAGISAHHAGGTPPVPALLPVPPQAVT